MKALFVVSCCVFVILAHHLCGCIYSAFAFFFLHISLERNVRFIRLFFCFMFRLCFSGMCYPIKKIDFISFFSLYFDQFTQWKLVRFSNFSTYRSHREYCRLICCCCSLFNWLLCLEIDSVFICVCLLFCCCLNYSYLFEFEN